MPPKGSASTRLSPVRLQTVSHIKVRRPNRQEKNPCEVIMSSMLNCWASAGQGAEGCAGLETQLRQCMDVSKPQGKKTSNINYHLSRMHPRIVGPQKKQG
ncbi:hypothetical protein PHISP_00208 [Aspergillus sp. HF37]|nr:hypothetical protein PHISP_00208 [Aspergillus sp. HF37]